MLQLKQHLSSIEIGNTQSFGGLALTPLFTTKSIVTDYLTLDDALHTRACRITELGDYGSVPEILFENLGDLPIFLLDGEELVGAKQNRIINISMLIPGHCLVEVPVSCVEAGRWSVSSAHFSTGDRTLYARARAHKAMHLNTALPTFSRPLADQGKVWDDIEAKCERLSCISETQAMDAMYNQLATSLDQYVSAFTNEPSQIGAIFSTHNHVSGLETFDSSDTWSKMSAKLIRSYALDAVDATLETSSLALDHTPASFLSHCISAEVHSYLAIAEGEDLRLSGTQLAGGALLAYDRIIHLCAFNLNHSTAEVANEPNNVQRPSMRQHKYED